ncbi:MAG: hypothetical protein ACD_73C00031G0003 [uncultured bacterium]|nr:MAG: hypothetical protein ACD_73C00031G0003 [uncultured bacterium]
MPGGTQKEIPFLLSCRAIMNLSYINNLSWKDFFPATSFVTKVEKLVREIWIPWKHTQIHLDVYQHPKPAPTIIYCHGLSSSGRMMANFAIPLFEKGFNVICPDLPGFGLTPLKRGSLNIDELTQALTDIVFYAQKQFGEPCFLTGISLGGTLSYYAAANGAPVKAIACLNLLDMSDNSNHEISRLGTWVKKIKPLIGLASRIYPDLSVSLKHFVNPDKLCSESSIVDNFKTNPLVVRSYTLKALNGLLTTAPKISFEKFDLCPVLVLHGSLDALIPEKLTKLNYDKIKGFKKYVGLKNGEHIPLHAKAHHTYINEVTSWFQSS